MGGEVTQKALQVLNFEDEISEERRVLRQLAMKAKQRYEKKYSGVELRNRVFRYRIRSRRRRRQDRAL